MSSNQYDYDVIVVGGGLAGLVAAAMLSEAGASVLLIEKRTYPYHKVCGEYVSNEVLGFLRKIGFDPMEHGASSITQLRISTPAGKNVCTELDLGGFGLSRYALDKELHDLAKVKGADVWTGKKVNDITFEKDHFSVSVIGERPLTSRLVIGAYGKRDTLDKKLDRAFMHQHTGYMGVKYHVRTDYPVNEIGLDNFEGGYCGIVKIEDDRYNICYLYKRDDKISFKSTAELEEKVLYKNPVLKRIFTSADFVNRQPEAINEICFDRKSPVEQHILMCGDTAGLITPLCGNGMSMAIAGAKVLVDLILHEKVLQQEMLQYEDRLTLENKYRKLWNVQFRSRLFWGRTIQTFFGNSYITEACVRAINILPPVRNWLIRATHGQPI